MNFDWLVKFIKVLNDFEPIETVVRKANSCGAGSKFYKTRFVKEIKDQQLIEKF